MEKVITIEGMSCVHCTGRVEKALRKIAGVNEVVMNLTEKTARISAEENVTKEALRAAVEEAGYEVTAIA